MIKWKYTVSRDKIGIPPIEHLEIGLDLEVTIVRKVETASVHLLDKTGDVTDQIYQSLKGKDYFKCLALDGALQGYRITVPLEKLDQLLYDVDLMDRSHFVQGKCY